MKKVLLTLCLVAGFSASYAQSNDAVDNTVVFTLGNGGEVLADGAVVNADEQDIITGYIKSGVWVKNTSDAIVQLSMENTVKSLSNGSASLCFPPGLCVPSGKDKVGILQESDKGALRAGTTADLMAEWIPEDYGTATVTYRIKLYNVTMNGNIPSYTFKAYGPTVTVNYNYNNPAGIDGGAVSSSETGAKWYDLSGREVTVPGHGLYVKKATMSDGSVKTTKVIIK